MNETWTDEDGVVFNADKTILLKAPKGLKEYIIPDGTKVIGEYAFSETSDTLECVLFPASVKVIEHCAFSPKGGRWSKLESIGIPNSVMTIDKKAFLNTKKLIYKGDAEGWSWGADVVIDNKKHYVDLYPYSGYLI